MAKKVQIGNLRGIVRSSRVSKLTKGQDSYLASVGKGFDDCFSVTTVKFGSTQASLWQEKFAEAIDSDGLVEKLVGAGAPQRLAELQVAGLVASINPNAGLNEAIRAYAVEQHDIPADFWDTEAGASTPAAEQDEVDTF